MDTPFESNGNEQMDVRPCGFFGRSPDAQVMLEGYHCRVNREGLDARSSCDYNASTHIHTT